MFSELCLANDHFFAYAPHIVHKHTAYVSFVLLSTLSLYASNANVYREWSTNSRTTKYVDAFRIFHSLVCPKKKMWRAPCWRCALCIVDLISRRRRRHAAPQTEINKRNNEIYFFCTLSGHVPNTHKRTRTRVLHTPKKVSSYEPHTSYDLATLTRLFSDSKYASIRVCNGMFVVRVCAVTVHRAVVLCCVLRTKIKKDRPQEDVEHRYFSSFHFIFHSHLLLLFYFSIILRHVGFTGCGVSVFLVRIRFWIELVQSGWWHHSCCCTVAVCTKALLCIWKCCNWKEHVLRFQLSLTMWERKADHVFIPRKGFFQTKWFLWISSPVRNS